ncbi:MAG TPA: SRPBCC domain-containing protein [Acidimicrobiales bacterium]|nr:SRPBCC domain-containing protein [Acidimicrobiales bacterium]
MTYELRFDRIIEAGREVVFDMFTEPDGQLAFYQGPEPAWIVRSHCDLRVGGEWLVEFGPSEDRLYRHRHVFEVIERPHRIRMTTTETRLDGSSFETEMEFVFEDEGGGRTRMTLHHSGFPTPELRDEHGVGLPKAFGQFGLFVSAQPR